MPVIDWDHRIWVSGFVLRSPDIKGRTIPEIERICGFHRGRLDGGGALYRLHWRVVAPALENAAGNLDALGLFPVSYNDERGPRDWDAMSRRAAAGDVCYNGYSVEQVSANTQHSSLKAQVFGAGDAAAVAALEAELASLYAHGGFIAKILAVKRHCANASVKDKPFEQYPAGSGIREYDPVKKQPFDLVRAVSSRDYGAGRVLDWVA